MSPEQQATSDKLSQVQSFVSKIESIRQRDVSFYDFNGIANKVAASNYPLDLRPYLPGDDGLHIDSSLRATSEKVHRISFEHGEGFAVGREDSRNNVFFGALTLNYFSEHGHSDKVKVAVKPFVKEDSDAYLASELYMMSELTQHNLDHVEVIGLLKSGNESFFLSRFKPEIITLDSIEWNRLSSDVFSNVIQRAVTDLARLHQIGLIHGDAFPRNMTVQPHANRSWYVDLEHGFKVKTPAQLSMSVKKDLREFYEGLCALRGKTPVLDEFVDTIYEPYVLSVLRLINKKNSRFDSMPLHKMTALIMREIQGDYEGEPVRCDERAFMLGRIGLE